VFLQRSAVNLLSSVLDTPEYFWSAPDHLQVGLRAGRGRARPRRIRPSLMAHARRSSLGVRRQIEPCTACGPPVHPQVLYKRVCEYLEIETRVEVLNTRFVVLQEFLDLLREHQVGLARGRRAEGWTAGWLAGWLALDGWLGCKDSRDRAPGAPQSRLAFRC
jgi:hypothetical protein